MPLVYIFFVVIRESDLTIIELELEAPYQGTLASSKAKRLISEPDNDIHFTNSKVKPVWYVI